MPLNLPGKVVLITGASRGLGLVLARQFASHGAKLVLLARDTIELETVRMELSRLTEVLALPCDVADRAAVESAVVTTVSTLGPIDVVINNASIIQVAPLDSLAYEDFRDAMEINFWGVVNTTLAVLPHFRRRGRGRLCNITSIGGKVAVPHLLPYDCAKFAAIGFSEGLTAELAKDGIHVTTVIPGLMRTGSAENALFSGQREREYAWFSAGAATPATAIAVERAARRIVRAIRHGEREVTLSWQAKVLKLAHALAPAAVIAALGLVDRYLLPAPGPRTAPTRGRDLPGRSRLLRSLIVRPALRTRQLRS